MPYIPLYPQSLHAISHPSIWAPKQQRNPSNTSTLWPCMPANYAFEQPTQPSYASFMTNKGTSGTLFFSVPDDTESQDVFGPVMSNESRASRLEVKKDVGAIGDRRKKDGGHHSGTDVRDMSDPRSTVRCLSFELFRPLCLPAHSSLLTNWSAPSTLHLLSLPSFITPRPAESHSSRSMSPRQSRRVLHPLALSIYCRRPPMPLPSLPDLHVASIRTMTLRHSRRAMSKLAQYMLSKIMMMLTSCPHSTGKRPSSQFLRCSQTSRPCFPVSLGLFLPSTLLRPLLQVVLSPPIRFPS